MAYDVTNGAIMQMQFEGKLYNQQVMTVMTYQYQGTATEEGGNVINEVEGVVTGVGGLWTKWLDCMSEDVQGCFRTYQWVNPARYAYQIRGIDTPSFGGIALTCPTPNISQAVVRRTELAGRTEVSTLKLPGVPADRIAGGLLLEPQLTVLYDFGAKSIEQIDLTSGSKMVPVPYHRAAPSLVNPLIFHYPDNEVRTMHRRRVGLGS